MNRKQPDPGNSFFGEDIIALLDLDPNERFVPLARMCEEIGIDPAAQARRIKANPILAEGFRIFSLPTANGMQKTPSLRLDLVPFWLAGVETGKVNDNVRERLVLLQRECASILWQNCKPQGFSAEDALLPPPHEMEAAEAAYGAASAIATLARHQMQVERQMAYARLHRDDQRAALNGTGHADSDDPGAISLAQAVRRVATTLSARTRRNEYGGAYSGLHRLGISSYRRLAPGRLREALDWLERWHGDLLGEPEPPPDI